MEYNLYVQNKDYCPDSDQILTQSQCAGCTFYKGFLLENGEPCVKCTYYQSNE